MSFPSLDHASQTRHIYAFGSSCGAIPSTRQLLHSGTITAAGQSTLQPADILPNPTDGRTHAKAIQLGK